MGSIIFSGYTMESLNEAKLRLRKLNFRYVQIDAIGVSMSNIAAPFLPVFLTRLGASNFQVGLLASLPGITGLLLAIFVGRFLQTRANIVPWYSTSRLLVIWAFATLPQIALAVSFTVVMNAVAGPESRYVLLSRRWTILGLAGVIGTYIVKRLIDLVRFPLNYAIMFLTLLLGGFLSYYFSSKITLPDQTPR